MFEEFLPGFQIFVAGIKGAIPPLLVPSSSARDSVSLWVGVILVVPVCAGIILSRCIEAFLSVLRTFPKIQAGCALVGEVEVEWIPLTFVCSTAMALLFGLVVLSSLPVGWLALVLAGLGFVAGTLSMRGRSEQKLFEEIRDLLVG